MDNQQSRLNKLLLTLTILLIFLGGLLILRGIGGLKDAIVKPKVEQVPPPTTTSAIQGVEGQEALVLKVIDGDTIEVQLGEEISSVRYIGIDTPETVDPRKAVECFGKEAANENKKLVGGKQIILVKDISEMDKFGRLLRYVYVKLSDENNLFVNDYLIRAGFAKAVTFPPDVKFTDQFLQAEKQAREAKRGFWGKC